MQHYAHRKKSLNKKHYVVLQCDESWKEQPTKYGYSSFKKWAYPQRKKSWNHFQLSLLPRCFSHVSTSVQCHRRQLRLRFSAEHWVVAIFSHGMKVKSCSRHVQLVTPCSPSRSIIFRQEYGPFLSKASRKLEFWGPIRELENFLISLRFLE